MNLSLIKEICIEEKIIGYFSSFVLQQSFNDGATMGNLGSHFNAWWAFRPGLSEMPIVAFFKGLRPGNVILRTRAWYRFNPNFAKGLGLGLLTYLNDVILVDPQIERWEDKSADIATQSSKNSKSASILTNSF